jgi:gluconate 5-dehydrogenase
MLLPGGATRTGMVPDPSAAGPRNLLEPEIMGPPIAWLASAEASGVTDERIVATEFEQWLSDRRRAVRTGT